MLQLVDKVERLYIFLQLKTTYFYQVKDFIELDCWEKFIDEETELETMYGIASIWSTIRNFEDIVQDMIVEDVEDNVVLGKFPADIRADQAGPSDAKDSNVHADDQKLMEELKLTQLNLLPNQLTYLLDN